MVRTRQQLILWKPKSTSYSSTNRFGRWLRTWHQLWSHCNPAFLLKWNTVTIVWISRKSVPSLHAQTRPKEESFKHRNFDLRRSNSKQAFYDRRSELIRTQWSSLFQRWIPNMCARSLREWVYSRSIWSERQGSLHIQSWLYRCWHQFIR